jgi:hypothetical protein
MFGLLDRVAVTETIGGNPQSEHQIQFVNRRDIETASLVDEQLQNFGIRIRLDGVIHFREGESCLELIVVLRDAFEVDDEKGCFFIRGECFDGFKPFPWHKTLKVETVGRGVFHSDIPPLYGDHNEKRA